MNSDAISSDAIFQCQQCGHCCQGFGGTYVSRADLDAIASYTGITENELRNRYCQPSGSRLVLAQKSDGYCVFWDRLCTIHPVKPRMCRAWPFIESVLRDPANWDIMAGVCPGIRTGRSESVIVQCVRQEREKMAASCTETGGHGNGRAIEK